MLLLPFGRPLGLFTGALGFMNPHWDGSFPSLVLTSVEPNLYTVLVVLQLLLLLLLLLPSDTVSAPWLDPSGCSGSAALTHDVVPAASFPVVRGHSASTAATSVDAVVAMLVSLSTGLGAAGVNTMV